MDYYVIEETLQVLFEASFMGQEGVYASFVKHASARFNTASLHLSMDRPRLVKGKCHVLECEVELWQT